MPLLVIVDVALVAAGIGAFLAVVVATYRRGRRAFAALGQASDDLGDLSSWLAQSASAGPGAGAAGAVPAAPAGGGNFSSGYRAGYRAGQRDARRGRHHDPQAGHRPGHARQARAAG